MRNTQDLFEEIKKIERRLILVKELIVQIDEYLKENDLDFFAFLGGEYTLYLKGKSKDLTKIRKMLRHIIGEWKDEIKYIGRCSDINVYYKPKDKNLDFIGIIIYYEKEEDLPKGITKDGKCGFQKRKYEIESWGCKEMKNDMSNEF